LVELLVVIGIIAVLISILLPALSRVRESSERTRCAANLYSLGQLLRLYANANEDRVPLGYINGVKQASYHIYTEGLPPTALGAFPLWGRLYQAGLMGSVWPGTGATAGFADGSGRDILGCRSETNEPWAASTVSNAWPPGSGGDSSRSSYSMRPVINWLPITGTDGYNPVEPMPRFSSFKGRKAIMCDLMVYQDSPVTRHRTGINVAYSDGSVTYQLWSEVRGPMSGANALSPAFNAKVDDFWSGLDRR
jgi:prepilin-type processing-associated H-X9-DG protein